MSDRELVIRHVTERMIEAFRNGDVVDAQNINTFIGSLERMTDGEYVKASVEEIPGAIS